MGIKIKKSFRKKEQVLSQFSSLRTVGLEINEDLVSSENGPCLGPLITHTSTREGLNLVTHYFYVIVDCRRNAMIQGNQTDQS